MAAGSPVLWQIKISHYNEKARWALDYKQVAYKSHSPPPLFGTLPAAWLLTRGTTLPVLKLDGRAIGDSTKIIAALEERFPEPPLYPSDPAERERALALEEFFDEQVAPQVRLVVWHETMKDSRAFAATALPDSGPIMRAVLRSSAPLARAATRRRYGVTEASARDARRQIVAGMERLESEIGPSGYLAGDAFSVADLTAAALFTPLLRPPERPYLPSVEAPEPLRLFCDELAQREGSAWILDMYSRHRVHRSRVRVPL